MKAPIALLFCVFFETSPCFGFSQTTGYCPTNAVFLALETEVRGYSTDANGMTSPFKRDRVHQMDRWNHTTSHCSTPPSPSAPTTICT